MKSAEKTNDGGLPRAGRTHQRSHRSWLCGKADAVKNRLFRIVGELYIFIAYEAFNRRHLFRALRGLILLEFPHDFIRAVKPCKCFRKLRTNARDLDHRGDHEHKKHVVLEIVARGPLAMDNRVAAEPHYQ